MKTEKAEDILKEMTLEEKLEQMSGDQSLLFDGPMTALSYNSKPFPSGENKRLGIEAMQFTDGPRGVVMNGGTCFPAAMARGASFDTDLEKRIGEAIGRESRHFGANLFAGICINLLRHPAWGRAQETYGEDMFHLGEMGAALTKGSGKYVMTCIKHYACNSMENARFKVDVQIDDRTLHEVYLPHFKKCIDAGATSVMSAYNKVNGDYCGHNRHLLREILKEEWGFKGFVMSDFVFGTRSGGKSAIAGLDMEMPFPLYYGLPLRRAVQRGKVDETIIDEAVLRILRAKIEQKKRESNEPTSNDGSKSRRIEMVNWNEHHKLAREAAQKSMVLLKNEPIGGKPLLPFDERVESIALIGELATLENTGDLGSSRCRPDYVISFREGLEKHCQANSRTLIYDDGKNPERAAALARKADVAIVVGGYTHRDEGEYIFLIGGDRDELRLKRKHENLIHTIAAANPRTAVVMVGGSAIITESWRAQVPALLMAWYAGMEGGHALADIVFGEVSPSGKLPCVFPKSAEQLPFFDKKAKKIEYGYLHGYRLLDENEEEPAFPFGFGLSYGEFSYSKLSASKLKDHIKIAFTLKNMGSQQAAEVVQAYVSYPMTDFQRPRKELKAFQRVELAAGKSKQVQLTIPLAELQFYNGTHWQLTPGTYTFRVGASSADLPLQKNIKIS